MVSLNLRDAVRKIVTIYLDGGCERDEDNPMILKSPFERYEEAAAQINKELDNVSTVNLAEMCKVIQGTLPDHVVIAFLAALNEYTKGVEIRTEPDWSDNMCWLSSEFLKMFKRLV